MLSLAWSNLTHDRTKFALSLLGVGFAVVLMFVQLGFRNGMLDAQTRLPDRLRADLVLLSPGRPQVAAVAPFPRRRLDQAAAVPGVEAAFPLFLTYADLRDARPADRRGPNRLTRVVGLDPTAFLLDLPELDPADGRYKGRELQKFGTALFDRRGRRSGGESLYGPLADGVTTELAGRDLAVVGGFDLGPDFTADGTLIVGPGTVADTLRAPYTLGPPLADVDLGLIRLAPGADPEAVRRAMQAVLTRGEADDPDVLVLTRQELAAQERAFWLTNTPIGFAFGFGLLMGFVVGLVICYQILSGDVADRLAEYATLKAIGHPNRSLAGVVLLQAGVLAVGGYLLGLAVGLAVYAGVGGLTGLPLHLTPGRAGLVFAATVGMCGLSAVLAVGRLLRADPADVF